jgi:hypothetical protein
LDRACPVLPLWLDIDGHQSNTDEAVSRGNFANKIKYNKTPVPARTPVPEHRRKIQKILMVGEC